jgi:hypothetical protein
VRTNDLPGAATDERRELHIFHRSEKYLQMVRRKKINSQFSSQGQDENNVCGWLHSASSQTRQLHRSYGIHGWDEAVRISGRFFSSFFPLFLPSSAGTRRNRLLFPRSKGDLQEPLGKRRVRACPVISSCSPQEIASPATPITTTHTPHVTRELQSKPI